MPRLVRWLGALVCAGSCALSARAQYPAPPMAPMPPHPPAMPGGGPAYPGPFPGYPPPPRIAPDACGPGYYCYCPDGSYIGPNYCLRPPFAPFNGILPPRGANGAPQAPMMGQPPVKPMVMFPTHPWARSPRDYFMWGEAQEDLLTRARRPVFVP